MTLAKRLLLGSAAAFVATSGAQAADLGLPVAPAVDYVQVCSIGSFTGFILPGSDVCFDISGFARGEATWGEEIDGFSFGDDDVAIDVTLDGAAPDTGEIDLSGATNANLNDNGAAAVMAVGADFTTVELDDILSELLDRTSTNAALEANSAANGLADGIALISTFDVSSNTDVLDGGATVLAATLNGTPIYSTANILGTAAAGTDTVFFYENTAGFSEGDVAIGLLSLYESLIDDTEEDELDIVGDARLNFDARTMTEYGLLRGFIRLDGNGDSAPNIEHAYVQMNVGSLGFTAGLAASAFDPIFTGYGSGARNGLMLGDDANEQFSVNAAVGNGVTVSFSIEEERADSFVQVGVDTSDFLDTYSFGTSTTDSGQSIPDFIAAIRVDQAWGSAKLAGVLTEVNPEGSMYDSEFGYALSGSAEFNLPIGVGSTFGVTGIYAHGANGYLGFNNTVGNAATGNADAVLTTTFDGTNTTYSTDLTTAYVVAAGFNFGLTNMVTLSIDGAYADIDHEGTVFDGNVYTVRGGIAYTPVNNLTINGHVTYTAADFNTSALRSSVDDDEWSARFRVTRSF